MPFAANTTGVVPASLSFLAIYNSSLSKTENGFRDEVVYFYDNHKDGHGGRSHVSREETSKSNEINNKRLRSVGLVQAMIQFANGFADGAAIDCVETEKSRFIVHNLDGEWWLLATVNLTQISRPLGANVSESTASVATTSLEYSSREVSPPTLLLQQLLRAHSVFLLHHGESLTDLWGRSTRERFCGILERFWDHFLSSWDVLLHGNPSVDIYNGLKLSAGGELGVGVGEEEWGSGEREVLEDFVQRTEGLVDLLVSRFDGLKTTYQGKHTAGDPESLLQKRFYAMPSDGIIFSGVGAMTRTSVRTITAWVEWVAEYGSGAYGIEDNPSSERRRRRAKPPRFPADLQASGGTRGNSSAIPAPIVPPKRDASKADVSDRGTSMIAAEATQVSASKLDESSLGTEMMKYLTLGVYGSAWGIPAGRPGAQGIVFDAQKEKAKKVAILEKPVPIGGEFLIGLLGDVEEAIQREDHAEEHIEQDVQSRHNGRISMRHLHVKRVEVAGSPDTVERGGWDSRPAEISSERLRVLVYVQKPFIFTFLFQPMTDSLSLPFFYRSLHHQLGPLREPLLKSTDPDNVAQRLRDAMAPQSSRANPNAQSIQDLVHDPFRLTVHSTIPNIPEATSERSALNGQWSRIEAISVHSQILNTYISTRRNATDLERTCKTSRGWWVVWMRLPTSSSSLHQELYREAILVRRANDHKDPKSRQPSSGIDFGFGFGFGRGRNASGSGSGGSKVVEGIGVDARQYVEGLLSLSR